MVRTVGTMALTAALAFCFSGLAAAAVVGDPNAQVNGNLIVFGGTNAKNAAFNLTTNTQFVSVKTAANPQLAFAVNSGTVNVLQVRSDASGNPEIRLSNVSNQARSGLFASRSSYMLGGLSLGSSAALSGGTLLRVNGTASVNVLEITGGADLAERFHVSDGASHEAGTVMCIDANNPGMLKISSQPYDRTVAGVVSGAAGLETGLVLGQTGHETNGTTTVALSGRVYVKADASQGAIVPGDMLTTSAMPGHAMKVTDYAAAQGAIIGKAMTPLAEGTGHVLVLVNLQ